MVPKDRDGPFQPGLFERYQRKGKALVLALVEMDVQGVSTRKVKAITEQLCDLTISKSQVSVLAKGLDEEILAVYDLPEGHRKRMRSTNMLERDDQELKRRTRVVRIFPNAASCLRLISAMAIETNQDWPDRRYLRMDVEEDAMAAEKAA